MRCLQVGICVVVVGMLSALAWADPGDRLAKILASDGDRFDNFGAIVATGHIGTMDIAIISAVLDNDNGVDSGSAYVFDISDPSHPVELTKFYPDDPQAHAIFGTGIAIEGTTVLIGACCSNDLGDYSGSAYLFDISDPANPVQLSKLLPSDGSANDQFGTSVALHGSLALIGSWQDSTDKGFGTGSAYVFDVSDPTNPVELVKLVADDAADQDYMGIAVDFGTANNAPVAVVGAWRADAQGIDSGAVYVFAIPSGEQLSKLVASDGNDNDYFGESLDANGHLLIIGAPDADAHGTASGQAYLFDLDTGLEITRFSSDDNVDLDQLGRGVALGGTTENPVALVSAPFHDNGNSSEGSAYVFALNDLSHPRQVFEYTPDPTFSHFFGSWMALAQINEQTIALIGDTRDGKQATDAGSVYVFDATVACDADLDNDGLTTIKDFLAFLNAWASNDPLADWNNDGMIDTTDFNAYLNEWTAGCP